MVDYNPNIFNKDLYKSKYHKEDLSNFNFLITGGAGFIGSNIVEYLLKYNAGKVRVLDNLSNGYYDNIKDFLSFPNFEFIQGDIRNVETCRKAVIGIDYISHQAALGSVPRSITDPITSNEVNIGGFLNMICCAKNSSTLKRFIYAASSSTYGDSMQLPKIEGTEGQPMSPYAITKAVNEMYAEVFSKLYDLHSIGLRYFNVFGPKQNPNNPYAAVIPIFCNSFINNSNPVVNGDGETSRDFTFVENAVQANIKALFYNKLEKHEVYNTACGQQTSLNEILDLLSKISMNNLKVLYKEERLGDIKHSKASIDKINKQLGYLPKYNFEEGLKIVYNWYLNQS
jgi:UDP-N-acetylglucosamine 4-epimerase